MRVTTPRSAIITWYLGYLPKPNAWEWVARKRLFLGRRAFLHKCICQEPFSLSMLFLLNISQNTAKYDIPIIKPEYKDHI